MHGGRRKGAGRPKKGTREQLSLRIDRALREKFYTYSPEHRRELIEKFLTKLFKDGKGTIDTASHTA